MLETRHTLGPGKANIYSLSECWVSDFPRQARSSGVKLAGRAQSQVLVSGYGIPEYREVEGQRPDKASPGYSVRHEVMMEVNDAPPCMGLGRKITFLNIFISQYIHLTLNATLHSLDSQQPVIYSLDSFRASKRRPRLLAMPICVGM